MGHSKLKMPLRWGGGDTRIFKKADKEGSLIQIGPESRKGGYPSPPREVKQAKAPQSPQMGWKGPPQQQYARPAQYNGYPPNMNVPMGSLPYRNDYHPSVPMPVNMYHHPQQMAPAYAQMHPNQMHPSQMRGGPMYHNQMMYMQHPINPSPPMYQQAKRPIPPPQARNVITKPLSNAKEELAIRPRIQAKSQASPPSEAKQPEGYIGFDIYTTLMDTFNLTKKLVSNTSEKVLRKPDEQEETGERQRIEFKTGFTVQRPFSWTRKASLKDKTSESDAKEDSKEAEEPVTSEEVPVTIQEMASTLPRNDRDSLIALYSDLKSVRQSVALSEWKSVVSETLQRIQEEDEEAIDEEDLEYFFGNLFDSIEEEVQ
jgi:hypothetical protein